jgi:hypothetical protein
MGLTAELHWIMSGDHVGLQKVDMFGASQKIIPAEGGPYLSVHETGGTSPENTQNSVIVPAYQKPGAQIVCRHASSPVAEAMARAAYNSLVKTRNQWIASGEVSATGTWYRKIRPLQEPYDMGALDAQGRTRWAFNVLADKRPS